ncbi:MAG: endonuclease [Proteobacteria bacterium]|jgi:mitochondrial cardiolipin hydrolase|nr:endonuclease [Pseudomonadota bacterium]
MKPNELDEILQQTLSDHRLSRTEKRALSEVLADHTVTRNEQSVLRGLAFDLAREEVKGHENQAVIDWLEEVVKVLHQAVKQEEKRFAEAFFTPGADGPWQICQLLTRAKRSVDICVFTITDDRIANAILKTHQRGVTVRVITDDEKTHDRGSDALRLQRAGIDVRTDNSDAHMHHKFAIFDDRHLLTGSYNWTRGAAKDNQENFVIVNDSRLVKAYSAAFDKLWLEFQT